MHAESNIALGVSSSCLMSANASIVYKQMDILSPFVDDLVGA